MIDLQKATEKKLNNYVAMFKGSYDKMINEILSYRLIQLQRAIKTMELDFTHFEEKYSMGSEKFYNLFENGKLGDENSDFYQWSGEYETYKDYQKEIQYLL
ncbi:MAG: hypothetical protein DRI95_03500 [Bacteroidetes bacterium]|nr:MAG: hypothetical protein DRI95_03500 [Bacteroidota bacterium]